MDRLSSTSRKWHLLSIDSSYSGSVRSSSNSFSTARLGSSRPARPAQLDQAVADHLAGGLDPQQISELSHSSAASLLDRVHHTQDPQIVKRVLSLIDHEGIDLVAELWSKSEADSLPGILWRLYTLRTWMHRNRESISLLWRSGEPFGTAASAIVGIDQTPSASDIAKTADSILSGAFTGDFAVALERACVFCEVIATGLSAEAERRGRESIGQEALGAESGDPRVTSLLRTSRKLAGTANDFKHGASLWRRGKLE
ncbi:hypothetical protein [Bifidobacterium psychraerophilum]|uniref:hypothetical protein n=1 Tax=Bifidobacterium psychraerophilum TaxID=218140 RepID=UPI003C6C9923